MGADAAGDGFDVLGVAFAVGEGGGADGDVEDFAVVDAFL
mgnify:CR=1 FL=1